ncbi:centromere protein P [Heteronotia binoei]|uniref:centromere protein P n=1 Tax=Heteronotia binoei TaxID=13085 RepID=UPI002931A843|nr:centromere protein P [Heteronotia binoei]XP_060095874.1 centromere protein P [Heteronotia binoei]
MNINSLQVYEDEIQSLENEIKMLTEEYERNQHGSFAYSKEKIKKAMKAIQRKFQEERKQDYWSQDLKTQLVLLESDFSFLMNFTGIWFKTYSRRLLEKSEIKTAYKYRLSGKCQSVPFQLEFKLTEEIQSNKNGYAVVSDLNIIIESEESSDLSTLVSRVEESGNLLLFFKSLSCFSEWCEYRKCTLAHFKNKYPNIVALPEGLSGDCMILKNSELPGFELMIVWKIQIDKDGKAVPVLDFLSKIPMPVLENKTFASDMPYWFRSLLHVFGIEASIEAVIKLLCSGK